MSTSRQLIVVNKKLTSMESI